MCCRLAAFLPPRAPSAKLVITYLNVNSDLLISIDSFYAKPVVPVADCLSDPARSTNCSLLTIKLSTAELSTISIDKVKIQWEREEAWFRLCEAITLFLTPLL